MTYRAGKINKKRNKNANPVAILTHGIKKI